MTDPVAEYKEILDATRQASRKLAERERKRTVELVAEIRAADKAIAAATDTEAKVKQEIRGWWAEVAVRMHGLAWITPGRPLDPDPAAHPRLLDDYVAEIQPRTNAFTNILRRASWPRRPA
ncbi:hypothetical protein [Actinocrispum wychmicini]|uniref:Uncharacterized protein n=1 Tax=Actinocrispum wychmicini TaxID=1213861 RepID=A0A4R2INA6_9PSEU|nr:hypothetical protein [Actinocrispum wychmicini]TCO46554.1 hypothetical protein EV192_119133 [Actinocrispum wychmicini]